MRGEEVRDKKRETGGKKKVKKGKRRHRGRERCGNEAMRNGKGREKERKERSVRYEEDTRSLVERDT